MNSKIKFLVGLGLLLCSQIANATVWVIDNKLRVELYTTCLVNIKVTHQGTFTDLDDAIEMCRINATALSVAYQIPNEWAAGDLHNASITVEHYNREVELGRIKVK